MSPEYPSTQSQVFGAVQVPPFTQTGSHMAKKYKYIKMFVEEKDKKDTCLTRVSSISNRTHTGIWGSTSPSISTVRVTYYKYNISVYGHIMLVISKLHELLSDLFDIM